MTRAVRLTTIAFLLCTAAALGTPQAFAGVYTVWSCRGPSGEPVATGAWERFGRPGSDDCAGGGALTARTGGGYELEAPIAGYRIWRSARAGWGGFAVLTEKPITRPVDGFGTRGDATQPLATANLVERSGVQLSGLAIAAGCHWLCTGSAFRLYRAAVDISDATPPTAAGELQVGDGTVAIAAADVGGGLRSAQLLLDGAAVASTSTGCAEPYTQVAPCPATAALRFAFAAGPGEHTLAVTATDAAGNTATLGSLPLTVPGPAPAPAAAPPAPAPAAPTARRLTVAKARFATGGATAITGRVDPAVPGATVIVERRWYGARGGGWKRVATLTSDARGGFTTPLPARAQQLRFTLQGSPSARAVDVVSRLGLTAHVRPAKVRNGQPVVLSGQLAGAGPAAAGEPVRIQAMISRRWQTVATVRANANGSFRWRYRFRNTRLEALYSFRARVADASARWPWPAIASPRVKVHVLP